MRTQDFIRFEDWLSFLASVHQAGIRYVVISDQQFAAGRHGFSFPAGQNEYAFCRRLVDRFGEKLSQYDHLQLYAISSAAFIPASASQVLERGNTVR